MDYEYIEFHNAYGEGKATLVIDLRSLPPEILISFRLSKLNLSQPIEDAISGIKSKHEADPDREPVPEVEGITFEDIVYVCKPSELVKIEYVYIQTDEFCAAVLFTNITEPLEPGSEYCFEVQQFIDDDILVGGSTYVIRSVDEIPRLHKSKTEGKEEEFSEYVYVHPWLNPPPQLKKREVPPWATEKDIITSWGLEIDNDHNALMRLIIRNGQLLNIIAIVNATKIIAKIQPIDSGRFIIELPRYVIDAKNENGKDGRFKVTVNGPESSVSYEEIFTSNSIRVLATEFETTTNSIHIEGTTML